MRCVATALLAIGLLISSPALAADELAPFLAQWGKPDRIDSTEYDRPRPPMVTKILTYRHKGRELDYAFLAQGRPGDPPPYKEWKFIGIVDQKAQRAVGAEEGIAFLRARRSGK
jgi:hypothetical protein